MATEIDKQKNLQMVIVIMQSFTIGLLVVLMTMLHGCAASNFYTQVDSPSLHFRGTTINGGTNTVYLTVSNPTSVRRHFDVECNGSVVENVIVHPRSDTKVRIMIPANYGKVTCNLKQHVDNVAP